MKKIRNSKVIKGISNYATNNKWVPQDSIYTISYDTHRDEFIVHNTASRASYILPLSEVKDFLKESENE